MIQSYKWLMHEHQKIKNLGWVPSMRTGNTGVGYTFESLLGVPENNSAKADYLGIELKCARNGSNSPLTLFTKSPKQHPYLEPPLTKFINIIKTKAPNTERIYSAISADKYNTFKGVMGFRVVVNREMGLVEVWVKYLDTEQEHFAFNYSFDEIKDGYDKIRRLALVDVLCSVSGEEEFFNYTDIAMLELDSFDRFIDCIESGLVRIEMRIKVENGRVRDRGTAFRVAKHNIGKVFMNTEPSKLYC